MVRLLIAAIVGGFIVQQSDPVVHMSKEPRHRVVFEGGTIRVQDIQIPPGDTTLFHTHDHPVLYIPISSSRTRSQPLGGEWDGAAAPSRANASAAPAATQRPGRVSSPVSYLQKPVTHRVNNVGDNVFRLIAIGNLSDGFATNTDDVSGLSEDPELLNQYYRAYRVVLPAGQVTASHKHAWPVIIVQQTAGAVAMEGSDKATRQVGSFIVHESGDHTLKNAGDTLVEFIEVEVRGGKTR